MTRLFALAIVTLAAVGCGAVSVSSDPDGGAGSGGRTAAGSAGTSGSNSAGSSGGAGQGSAGSAGSSVACAGSSSQSATGAGGAGFVKCVDASTEGMKCAPSHCETFVDPATGLKTDVVALVSFCYRDQPFCAVSGYQPCSGSCVSDATGPHCAAGTPALPSVAPCGGASTYVNCVDTGTAGNIAIAGKPCSTVSCISETDPSTTITLDSVDPQGVCVITRLGVGCSAVGVTTMCGGHNENPCVADAGVPHCKNAN